MARARKWPTEQAWRDCGGCVLPCEARVARRDIVGEKNDRHCQDETTLVFRDANAMIWDTHKAVHGI